MSLHRLSPEPVEPCGSWGSRRLVGMDLEDALMGVGRSVVYNCGRADHLLESGVISAVNTSYVFVQFGNSSSSKACSAETLTFIDDLPEGTQYK